MEIKLDYSIEPDAENRYRVESYFFIPRSLGVTSATYSADEFYRDVQAYIRFKTPQLPLTELAGEDCALGNLKSLLKRAQTPPVSNKTTESFSREARLFACMLRARFRDKCVDIADRVTDLTKQETPRAIALSDLNSDIESTFNELACAVDEWRGMRCDSQSKLVAKAIRETYQFVDEFLSLSLEQLAAELLRCVDRAKASELASAREMIRERILLERDYRVNVDYLGRRYDDQDDDYFLYRQGKLKKFVTSVLWLDITKEKDGRRLADFGAAIAAGCAMLFAVASLLWHGKWAVTNTTAFVVAATITYMLKDRIKDWLKRFFARKLTKILFDHSVKIKDPLSGKNLGRCREAMSYVSFESLPKEVAQLRHNDEVVSIDAEAKPEVVIRYEKDIRLSGTETIERLHTDQHEVNDIIRFSLHRLLQHADDPITTLPHFDEKKNRVKRKAYRKVYHLNVVMVFRKVGSDTPPLVKRMRVVFDKAAILRVEEVA